MFRYIDSAVKRISGEGFLRFSGMGVGSFGLLRNFLVVIVLTSMESIRTKILGH